MTGLIILAAGASVRLGKPKQTLRFKGKSLVQLAVEAGLQAHCHPVAVITGAYAGQVLPELNGYNVQTVFNALWEEGMASGIRCGITWLLETEPMATGAIVMVCDQPFADAALLYGLIQKHLATGIPVIGSQYKNTVGVPAYFSKTFFSMLLLLKGQEGAKKLLATNKHLVDSVPFPLGGIDIDTLSDYAQLTAMDT